MKSLLVIAFASTSLAADWPGWRGPAGTGVSTDQTLPLTWSASENIRWRTELPERGNSSPIVWGDKVFVTQAVTVSQRRTLMCFDRDNGNLLWQSGPTYTEHESTQRDNPYCAATPVTDGERVIASFGSAGLYCYDFAGREQWHRADGKMEHEFGNAASPMLVGNLCIWNFGPGNNARLIAVNKYNGGSVWEARAPKTEVAGRQPDQPDAGGSWSTPILISIEARQQLIATLPGCVVAYEPQSGRQLWFSQGLGSAVYASPVIGDDLVVATTTGPGVAITVAVKPSAKGEEQWRTQRPQGPVGSGVVHQGHLYSIRSDGIASCVDLKNGKSIWEERLKGPSARGSSWSSMVLSGDRIYLPNQSGDVFVLRAAREFEVLAINSVNESTNASLAVADGEIILRTDKALWCIGGSSR